MVVGDVTARDWPAVRAVYEQGIATGEATFETDTGDWDAWDARHLAAPRLAARRGGELVGWAALSPVSQRCVYAGVAEVSVYVAAAARGQGVGRLLLSELVARAGRSGLWTLQAGVMRENATSLALFAACGFRTVGTRERLGQLHGRWRDVVLLERRLPTAGDDAGGRG